MRLLNETLRTPYNSSAFRVKTLPCFKRPPLLAANARPRLYICFRIAALHLFRMILSLWMPQTIKHIFHKARDVTSGNIINNYWQRSWRFVWCSVITSNYGYREVAVFIFIYESIIFILFMLPFDYNLFEYQGVR